MMAQTFWTQVTIGCVPVSMAIMAYLGLPSALMMEASVFYVMARGIMAKMITPYSCAICMFASVAPIRRSRPSPHR